MEIIKKYKTLITFVITILCTVVLYFSYQYNLDHATEYIEIPISNKYLKSGDIISFNDISYTKMPRYMVSDQVEVDSQMIEGKFVNLYNSIAETSMFYKELIADNQDIADNRNFNLNENEVAISIDVDMKTSYGNSIKKGHKIDVYFQGYAMLQDDDEKKVLYGPLVNGARVIEVRDKDGKSLDKNVDNIPSVIVLALEYEDADIVQRAKFFGDVLPIISYDTLNQMDANYYDTDKMRDILYQRTIDVKLIQGEEYEQ